MPIVPETTDNRPIFFFSVYCRHNDGRIHSSAGMTRASSGLDIHNALNSGWLPGWGHRFIWVFPASDAHEPINTNIHDWRRMTLSDMDDQIAPLFQADGI